jgi:cell division protein FtsB
MRLKKELTINSLKKSIESHLLSGQSVSLSIPLAHMFLKKYINNRYFYTGLLFVVWMVFFDKENIVEQLNLSRQLNELEDQKEFYLEEIKANTEAINVLENDTTLMEKYAREKYYMKKDGEDVFVLVPEKE